VTNNPGSNEYKPGVEYCGLARKQIFATKQEAKDALGSWAWRKGSRKVEKGRCISCNGYHLTKGVRGRGYGK
jgi:hypothetical protein